jgi:hypothetical protein
VLGMGSFMEYELTWELSTNVPVTLQGLNTDLVNFGIKNQLKKTKWLKYVEKNYT